MKNWKVVTFLVAAVGLAWMALVVPGLRDKKVAPAPMRSTSSVETRATITSGKELTQAKVISPTMTELEKTKLISKRQQARETALFNLQAWLAGGNLESREKALKHAYEHPLEFMQVTNQLLEKLPSDVVEPRKQLLGMSIDVAESVLAQLPMIGRHSETAEQFFEVAEQVIDRELMLPEIVESERLSKMTYEQKDTLAHAGRLVSVNGEFVQSTFESKVMALQLAARLPDPLDREVIAKRVAQGSYGRNGDYTNQTLEMVAGDLLRQ